MVWGLAFRAQGVRFKVWGLRFTVWGLGLVCRGGGAPRSPQRCRSPKCCQSCRPMRHPTPTTANESLEPLPTPFCAFSAVDLGFNLAAG